MISDPVLIGNINTTSLFKTIQDIEGFSGGKSYWNTHSPRTPCFFTEESYWNILRVPFKSLEHIIDDKLKVLFVFSLPKQKFPTINSESGCEKKNKDLDNDEVNNLRFNRPNLNHL